MESYDLCTNEYLPEPLSNEELYCNFEKMKLGDMTARKEIVIHNMRLVRRIAGFYANALYDESELFSIGMVGLIKSVDNFDTTKKVQFSTYLYTCVRNEIFQFFNKEQKHNNSISLNESIKTQDGKQNIKLEDVILDTNSDFVSKYEDNESY